MTERSICDDYKLRDHVYEIWVDGSRNWWLSGGHKPGWVLTEDDFDPPLTNKEVADLNEYIDDWFTWD